MMFSTINKYLYKNYFIGFIIILSVFSLLIFTGDLIENFRRTATKDVPISIVFSMSFYNFFSLIYETIPIIIFFSYIFSTVNLIRTSEYTIFKSSGLKNSMLIASPSILFILISFIFILAVNPLSALFHSKYDELNYIYVKQADKYASISKNGIWLKQYNEGKKVSSILNSKSIEKEGEILKNFMILEYNQIGSFTGRLDGKRAELKDGFWILYSVTEHPRYSESQFHEKLEYKTTLKFQDISNSLVSPDNISIYELSDFIALIEKLGYSAIDHKLEYYNLIFMPILILSLVVLAHSLTFKLNHNDKILNLMILSIFCVFIFYFISNLFNALSLSSQINPLIGISLVPLILFIISTIFFKIPNKLF